MTRWILIAICGGVGSLSRYLLDGWVSDFTRAQFPWGTFTVNLIGSFLLGILVEVSTSHLLLNPNWRIALGIGFLGGFTTFSTFAYETVHLFEDSAHLLAVLNIIGTTSIGIAAAYLGLVVGRTL
jgi:CrcB protein